MSTPLPEWLTQTRPTAAEQEREASWERVTRRWTSPIVSDWNAGLLTTEEMLDQVNGVMCDVAAIRAARPDAHLSIMGQPA